ncbi:MAG: FABP family protein, partial [Herbaspirillum sp.]
TVEPNATSFELVAEAGSETYGICQNPSLLENFKVVRYILRVKCNSDGSIDYDQDTQLQIKGRGLMHHTDANHLKRVP